MHMRCLLLLALLWVAIAPPSEGPENEKGPEKAGSSWLDNPNLHHLTDGNFDEWFALPSTRVPPHMWSLPLSRPSPVWATTSMCLPLPFLSSVFPRSFPQRCWVRLHSGPPALRSGSRSTLPALCPPLFFLPRRLPAHGPRSLQGLPQGALGDGAFVQGFTMPRAACISHPILARPKAYPALC